MDEKTSWFPAWAETARVAFAEGVAGLPWYGKLLVGAGTLVGGVALLKWIF